MCSCQLPVDRWKDLHAKSRAGRLWILTHLQTMVVIIVVVVGVLPAMSLPVVPLHESLEVWAIGWLVCVWVRVAIVAVVKDIWLISIGP